MAKARLMIDFTETGDLARFFAEAKRLGLVPNSAGVFEADALDFLKDTGITRKHTYIMRGDNAEGEGRKRLMVTTEVPV